MKYRLGLLIVAALLAPALLAGCGGGVGPLTPEPQLDTTPPPAPTGLSVGMDESVNRGVASWTASAAADVADYDVFTSPDGVTWTQANVAPVTTTQFGLDPVSEDTVVYVRVRARDLAGNLSANSSTASGLLEPGEPVDGDPGERDHFE